MVMSGSWKEEADTKGVDIYGRSKEVEYMRIATKRGARRLRRAV